MTFARRRLGLEGESIAALELERRGYQILERNYRTRFGEIDIIAKDVATVVFVEVKTKTDGRFGDPAEMVTAQKQRRLASMADEYAAGHQLHATPCRFDVVAIDASITPPRITIYPDAFRPGW